MQKRLELGTFFGLRFTAATGTVIVGLGLLAAAVAIGAMILLDIPAGEAIVGGLICAVLHVFLEIGHQAGHAIAARRTGYPMKGIHFWWVLGGSVYSRKEGDLPARIHIRRALGGPIGSAVLSIVLVIIALAMRPWDQSPGWIAAFLALDNVLVFTLGAFLPLGFTDGSTLLEWWGK